MHSTDQSILKTLCYADIFDFPLLESEIFERLISPVPIGATVLHHRLIFLHQRGYIKLTGPYYHLKNRSSLVKKRSQRQHWSKRKLQVATQIASKLKTVPFLESIFLTGAVSVNNATKNEDIDICLITTPDSLWTCRLFAVLKLERLGIRRRPHNQARNDQICLNLLMAANELTVPPTLQNLYTAHEVVQTKPIFDPKGYYPRFLAANSWIYTYLPNSLVPKIKTRPPVTTPAPRSIESGLRFLEQLYMRPRRTREVITPGKAYFHPRDTAGIVLAQFAKKIMEYHLS